MFTEKIIHKVPGNIPAESKKEKQGYIGDLSTKTTPQLKELLERQDKLVENKSFINKLPDKGEKIKRLKNTIEEELKKRSGSESLSKMMSGLTLNGKQDLDALEWRGKCAPGYNMAQEDNQHLSDEENNPLKILANHSGAGFHKKKLIVMKPDEPLIKPSDLAGENTELMEEYAQHLCDKYDSVKPTDQSKPKFLPYKTLIAPVPEAKKVGKHWEVTAATPPPIIHGDTQLVSLQQSIQLQSDQQHKFKEIQTKLAMERLSAWQGSSASQVPQASGNYRDHASDSSSEDEHSEHEVLDEEYPDGGGVVVYNLVDDTMDTTT